MLPRLLHALETLAAQEHSHIEAEDWTALDQLLDRQLALIREIALQLNPFPHRILDSAQQQRLRRIQAGCAARIQQLAGITAAGKARLDELEATRRHLHAMRRAHAGPPQRPALSASA